MKKYLAIFTVLVLFTATAVGQSQQGQLEAKGSADPVSIAVGEISQNLDNLLSLTTETEEFVQGENIQLTADQLYVRADGWGDCRTGNVWLDIRNSDGEVVHGENLGQWKCLSSEPLYEYSTQYQIPEDIGSESGAYTFRMFFVDDYSNTELCGTDPYGDAYKPDSCVAKVGNIQQLVENIIVEDDTDNLPPTVSIDAPIYANQNEDVVFTAEVSNDVVDCKWTVEGGDDVAYSDDGSNLRITRTWGGIFDESGNKDVSVTCKDLVGQEDTANHLITISEKENVPPIVRATAQPSTVETGEKVTFSAKQSSDEDGTIESCEWSNGRTSKEFQTSFDSAGEETLSVTCFDNQGDSDDDSVSVTVESSADPVEKWVFTDQKGECELETFESGNAPRYSFDSESACESYGQTGLNPLVIGILILATLVLLFIVFVLVYILGDNNG